MQISALKKTAVLLAALMLTACAQPPKNVNDRNSSQAGQNSSLQSREQSKSIADSKAEKREVNKTVSEKDLEKCVQGSTDIILAGKYDNLKIDSNFKVIANAYPSDYQASVPTDYEKNADSVFGSFLPDKTQGYYPSQKKLHNDPNSDNRTYEYSNSLKQGYVSSNGIVAIVEKEYMNKAIYGTSVPVTETRNLLMPVTDDRLSLGSAELDIRDVNRQTDEILNLFSTCNNGKVFFKPYSISTIAEQSGETLAFMHCRREIDGIPVFDSVPHINDQFLEMPIMFGPVLAFNDKCRAVQMNFSQNIELKEKKDIKEILTPEYAFEAASKSLAPHIDHTARFEELVLVPTVANSERSHQQLKAGDNVTLKPYWVIHFETDWWKEVYAAVDAVTGEVYYVNNRS
ncbi:MAG: hypothetical protein IJM32_10420 [Ruminococcus sp.]|nr:hypothetical protein [Ruminococcus sp.]